MKEDQDIEIEVFVEHETLDAVLVEYEDEKHWLPKSQINGDEIVTRENCLFTIPYWLAYEKGMI